MISPNDQPFPFRFATPPRGSGAPVRLNRLATLQGFSRFTEAELSAAWNQGREGVGSVVQGPTVCQFGPVQNEDD